MKTININFEDWQIECIPDDGARISVLRYAGFDLLTTKPLAFKAPVKDYGEYETRPVYGYDDCFPSVSACKHPVENFFIRDHGQLCWLKWDVKVEGHRLICSTECDEPNVRFTRTLEFLKSSVNWKFDIENKTGKSLDFIHVIHPLMPLGDITKVDVPGFKTVFERENLKLTSIVNSSDLNDQLLKIKPGNFQMLFLSELNDGFIILSYQNKLKLKMSFDHKVFPTLGVWWNNSGYPAEQGLERCECAFEPVPGTNSNLESTYNDGVYLSVEPDKVFSWECKWKIVQETL